MSSRREHRIGRGEAGETLAELLVTISIIGLAVVVLVGALGTAIMASTSHREHSTADTIARSIAETLKNPDATGTNPDRYVDCASPSTYPIGNIDATGYKPTLAISYWKRNSSAAREQSNGERNADFVDVCPTRDQGLQLITVTVKSEGAKAESATVSVLKRRISPL
jgi:hypothetical protein